MSGSGKDLSQYMLGQTVDIVIRGTVDADDLGRVVTSDKGNLVIRQAFLHRPHVVEVRVPPKPDYDEGDLVVDASRYIFQKAPVGAEDEAGQKATENDGFWLVSDDEGRGSTGPSLWTLNNMDFPLTRIPKERLL